MDEQKIRLAFEKWVRESIRSGKAINPDEAYRAGIEYVVRESDFAVAFVRAAEKMLYEYIHHGKTDIPTLEQAATNLNTEISLFWIKRVMRLPEGQQ